MCEYTPLADGTACDESNECTTGMCANGECDTTPVLDGTVCGNGVGTCQLGICRNVACNEQGIRDAIAAGGGPYAFDCVGDTTVATKAEIVIDNDVILDGEGNLTVAGNLDHRVFSVPEGVTAELHGLTVTRGAWLDGPGIFILGTLTITDSTVSDCVGDLAGAVMNLGTLTMMNCTVSGNEAGFAAGILNNGEMTMTNCTVSGNLTGGNGGGITNVGDGGLTMTNCTVSGNTAGSEGGGILNGGDGTLTMTNSSVAGNTAGGKGGGIMSGNAGRLSVANSLIEGDCVTEDSATVVSNGYNIESPGDTCGFDQTGDQAGVSAVLLDLQPLANNGGPTQTHAITTNSAAFNAGTCEVDEDQRGVTRPQGPACDVGAFELEVTP